MTPEERADQWLANGFPTERGSEAVNELATLIREAENDAYEKAVHVCETTDFAMQTAAGALLEAVERIRALKHPDPPKEEPTGGAQ